MTSREMRRIAVVALVCLLAAVAAAAQPPPKTARIGILEAQDPSRTMAAVRARLAELGWTVQYETRYAEGRPERMHALAAELVRLNVDVIVTGGTHATKAVKEATNTIPIVFVGVSFPVASGLVASLARPGGNVTGATDQSPEVFPKLLQFISETVPRASRIGVIDDLSLPGSSAQGQAAFQAMAKTRGLTVVWADVRTPDDVEPAFVTLSRERVAALILPSTPAVGNERGRVAKLFLQNRLPVFSIYRFWVELGALMSYGPNYYPELARQAADHVDRILNGAKPADLPVVRPTKFDLVINMKTAKALGVTLPRALLLRADEIIE